MPPIDPRAIDIAALTDVGRVRQSNQDHYGEASGPGGRLLVVADGMGGHRGGETASRVAVEVVERVFRDDGAASPELLRRAFEAANAEVHRQSRDDSSLFGMGTTGVALLIAADGRGWVANVGDSRAYRLRDAKLEQLTRDHSLVAELRRRGMLTAEEAAVHPRRNELLRSLGVDADVDVDVDEIEVAPGDLFLLCSDGLSNVVGDAEVADVLRDAPPEEAARRLVDLANERGGPDNVTVQVARVPGSAQPTGAGRARWVAAAAAAAGAALVLWLLRGAG